jgi:hypothetical protein
MVFEIIMPAMDSTARRRIFSLEEAQLLLPKVKTLTAEAVRRANALAAELEIVPEDDPAHARLTGELHAIVAAWAMGLQDLDVEAKGLWLVDFDNGEGYYCWRHPEATITHFHGYEDGFAGRMKIL